MSNRFDPDIFELIPHRPPMLLINRIVTLNEKYSETIVLIDSLAPFSTPAGVPSWIGLEYMGQTSALIAGYQEQKGFCEPQLGFLMGSRKYTSTVDYFTNDNALRICCEQGALVGSSLANFNCTISSTIYPADPENDSNADSSQILATASLSVYRRPLAEIAKDN